MPLSLLLVGCATASGVARESPAGVPPSPPDAEAAPAVTAPTETSPEPEVEPGIVDPRAFMSFRQIWKVIEDSPRRYNVVDGVPGTYTNQVWPVGDAPTASFRVVVDSSGERTVASAEPLPAASQRRLDVAEEAFRARRFKEAEEGYRSVLKRHPDHFPVQLVLGDALLFQGRSAEALAAYERAATLAPRSYSAWFFQASALLRLERFDEAADRYARALSLRPSWPSILQAIESNGRHIGRQVAPTILKPRARAYLDKDQIFVEADPNSFAWMAHAVCKAMWLGETELRTRRVGTDTHGFTYLEEGECLGVLLNTHRNVREEQPDPALDRALQIAEEGFLAELISYEILSRVVPMAIPVLDEAMLERLHTFVERYVLIPTQAEDAPSR